jgi:putative protease
MSPGADVTSNRPCPPELRAPAGNFDCARAAVANGADAIYFGLDCGFNARARAANFAPDDLPDLIAFLHRHGVRGYVTLNTLAFSDELDSLESLVKRIALARVDAVLVQDLGLVRLIRRVAPALSIHASTQMTLTSAECIAAAAHLGIERVVLARELSIREIAKIRSQTDMPLEVFVHGALCVAYSGQCLTSESFGGRSANRGQCAQACRLPYELVCDGKDVDLAGRPYVLSPQDLAAYALVPELMAAGVQSLKIEGRLKTPEYVANITRHYRQAIDAAVAGRPVEFTPHDVQEMELSFSRGFSVGWLKGCDHKMLVPADSSAKRGVLVGEVIGVSRHRVRVRLQGRLKAGDGIVFEGDRAAGKEQGGRVFDMTRRGNPLAEGAEWGEVEISFPRGSVDLDALTPGLKIWKNDDPALTRKWRGTFAGEIAVRAEPIRMAATARVGSPLHLTVTCAGLPPLECRTEAPLDAATKHPLTRDVLFQQLGRLGGTGFALASVEADIVGTPMVPLSILGRLRHEIVAQLTEARTLADAKAIVPLASQPVLPELRREDRSKDDTVINGAVDVADSELIVLCRSLRQLEIALAQGVREVDVDFQDIREYRQAVTAARNSGTRLLLATPRIQKPDEVGIFRALARWRPDGILARNLAGLDFFVAQEMPCVADFSLNAANELTTAWLLEQGAQRVTASYDMNRDQLLLMAQHSTAPRLEIVVHQHMPMFHMEHCVFCAVLSPGTNKTNCGRPCDDHNVQLRDRIGVEHPLKADVGCRNTLFNATPQSGAEVVGPLQALGVRHFRIELLHDDAPEEIARTIDLYRRLLKGTISGADVWRTLKAHNRVGVTRGTLEHSRDPLAIL